MEQIDLVDVCGERPYIRPPYCRVRTQTLIEGESMTQQSHADSVDVNNIIRRFDRTGQLPPALREGVYDDVTGLQGDLTERIEYSRDVSTRSRAFADEWKPPVPAAPAAPSAPSPTPPS